MAAKTGDSAKQGEPVYQWSAASVSPAQRLDYFASALAEALIPMKVERRSGVPFHAEMRFLSLGPIEIGRQTGDARSIYRGPREMRDRIHDCVRAQCASSSLTASDIARALAISVRTLHRCLAANGETFGETLMSARVGLAHRAYADAGPQVPPLTVRLKFHRRNRPD